MTRPHFLVIGIAPFALPLGLGCATATQSTDSAPTSLETGSLDASVSVSTFAESQPKGGLLPGDRIYLRNNSTSSLTFYLYNVEGSSTWARVRMAPGADAEIPARTLWIAVATLTPQTQPPGIADLNPLASAREIFAWKVYQVRLLRERTRYEICFSAARRVWVTANLSERAC